MGVVDLTQVLISSSAFKDAVKGATSTRALELVKSTLAGGLNGVTAGIVQIQAEEAQAAAAGPANDSVDRLQRLELADPLQEILRPRLAAFGYTMQAASVEHDYGGEYTYSALRQGNGDSEIALAQIPTEVMDTDRSPASRAYIAEFTYMIKAFRGRRARLCCEGIGGLESSFDRAFRGERAGADWEFVNWWNIVHLSKGSLKPWQALLLGAPDGAAPPVGGSALPPATHRPLEDGDVEDIITILVRHAISIGNDSSPLFRAWVEKSPWELAWKLETVSGWTTDALYNARRFVNFARGKGSFPRKHAFYGETVLGQFLATILKNNELGGEDAAQVARIVIACGLVRDTAPFAQYL